MIVRRPRIDSPRGAPGSGARSGRWARRRHLEDRASRRTPDGSAHPDMQLNIMNARVIALVAQARDRWPLAGDQLYIDMDLSDGNLPPGTELALGDAVIEITAAASHRLPQVRRAIRTGRDEVGQFPGRQGAAPAGRERQGGAARDRFVSGTRPGSADGLLQSAHRPELHSATTCARANDEQTSND